MLKPKAAQTKTSVFFSCKESREKKTNQNTANLNSLHIVSGGSREALGPNFFIVMQFSVKIMPTHRLALRRDPPLIVCDKLKEIAKEL